MNTEILTKQLDTPRKNKATIRKCKRILEIVYFNGPMSCDEIGKNLNINVNSVYANIKRLSLYLDFVKTSTGKKYFWLNEQGIELVLTIIRAQSGKGVV